MLILNGLLYKSNPDNLVDFLGLYENVIFKEKSDGVTFRATLVKYWSAFYYDICGQSYKQFTLVIY